MAQSTILAKGVTEATSTDVAVAAGANVVVGLFGSPNVLIPSAAVFSVMMDTPEGDQFVINLGAGRSSISLSGPATYRVVRNQYTGDAFGVFLES